MAQDSKIENIGSIGSIMLAILEVQEVLIIEVLGPSGICRKRRASPTSRKGPVRGGLGPGRLLPGDS